VRDAAGDLVLRVERTKECEADVRLVRGDRVLATGSWCDVYELALLFVDGEAAVAAAQRYAPTPRGMRALANVPTRPEGAATGGSACETEDDASAPDDPSRGKRGRE
jgi:hypothetical protein